MFLLMFIPYKPALLQVHAATEYSHFFTRNAYMSNFRWGRKVVKSTETLGDKWKGGEVTKHQ